MAKKTKADQLRGELVTLRAELEALPDEKLKVEGELQEAIGARDPLQYGSHVQHDAKATEQLQALNVQIADLESTIEAWGWKELQLRASIDETVLEIARLEEVRDKREDGQLEAAIEKDIQAFEANLLDSLDILNRLQASYKTRLGLAERHGWDLAPRKYRLMVANLFSPRVVLILNRHGGLNLEATISRMARQWLRDVLNGAKPAPSPKPKKAKAKATAEVQL